MSSSRQDQVTSRFFWDKITHQQSRSRFNLLLLEHGEYFFEDISVYYFPIATGRHFHHCDALKTQGRLKLCSRSIIFEPTDHRKAIVKYTFKNIKEGGAKVYRIARGEQCSADVTGFFSFKTTSTIEMMENDKIGPYRLLDHDKVAGTTVLFASVHTQIDTVLKKINDLYQMYLDVEKEGLTVDFLSRLAVSSTNSFDTSQLVDFHETLLIEHAIPVKKIKPLTVNPGCLMITDKRLYFQPAQLNNVGDTVQHYDLGYISRVYKRRYLLQHTCMEIILHDGTSAFFCFESNKVRDATHSSLFGALNGINRNKRRASLNVIKSTPENVLRQWQRREISNYDYLMYLNNEADRSMNDLTQYPVFPHVVKDFSSEKLDLKNPQTFRDLSKPIGALNPIRLENFKNRFRTMPERDDEKGIPPPFLYGTHYSTPGYVLHYLVRIAPEYMLCLQNGKFDAPDRSFLSVGESWESCLRNPADLKELIPEFFVGNGDFLVNNDDLDLGHRHSGERLNDVDLPPWAKSPRDYIRKHAKALESDYVSSHLHEWIDLIFGYKQQGQAAVDSDNVFYYLTYEGSVDLEMETNTRTKRALEMQIQEFGQCPLQLFSSQHPARDDFAAKVEFVAVQDEDYDMEDTPHRERVEKKGSVRSIETLTKRTSEVSLDSRSSRDDALSSTGITNEQPEQQGIMGSLMGVFGAYGSQGTIDPPTKTRSPPLPESSVSPPLPPTNETSNFPSTSSMTSPVTVKQQRFSSVSVKSISSSFNGHSEAISDIAIADGNNSVIATCSRDALLKVLQLDSAKGSAQISTRRSCAPSDPNPVSSCCIAKNGNTVFAGCFDNVIYSYSIMNACITGRTQAHDDSVSSLAISDNGKWLISGSWDATVKVWAVGEGEVTVALEMYDHESAVVCVALDATASYAVAGGEDGSVIVWKIDPKTRTSRVVFTKVITATSRRPVTSVQWLPTQGLQSDGFADEKFVCGSADGLIVCLDITGRLFAATRIESTGSSIVGIRALSLDCRGLVWGGCDDDCIRVWTIEKGFLKELMAQSHVHDDEVTALAMSSDGGMLVSGGGEGEVKVWLVECH